MNKFVKNLTKINQRNIVIMTGIQPTGLVHIGNFLGSIKECKKLSSLNEVEKIYIGIVDLHSLTTNFSETKFNDTLNLFATLYATGFDSKKMIPFQQSKVSYHSVLSWILMCLCPLARVQELPQWKEKKLKSNESGNCGLLMYPILQSADILLYRPDLVPVGEDQRVHLDLTRFLRNRLIELSNGNLNKFIPIPKLHLSTIPKIHSLTKPMVKMSKSDPDDKSRLCMTDSDDDIKIKIRKSITDSISKEITYDPELRPALANLMRLYSSVTDRPLSEIIKETSTLNKVQFKERLCEATIEMIRPIREETMRLLNDRNFLINSLSEGSQLANERANETIEFIMKDVGLGLPDLIDKKENSNFL